MGLLFDRPDWPVLDGVPTRPYEIPEDGKRTEAELRHMAEMNERRERLDRTGQSRALSGFVSRRRERRGLVFGRVLFDGRLVIEWRVRHLGGCEETTLLAATSKWERLIVVRKAC